MKILYLPVYYSPEQAASPYLGRNRNQAFCEAGFSIVTHVPVPSRGVSSETRKKYKKKEYRKEYQFGGRMVVNRFYMFKEGKSAILRVFRYLCIFIVQSIRGLRETTADCIFLPSTPPVQGLLGCFLKRRLRIPFIYNLQDIFPDSLVGTGLTKKGSILWRMGRRIENYIYRHADKIIVISEDFKRNILEKGVPEDKITVIYNWVDQNAVVSIPRSENKLFDIYGLDRDLFYISYAGNIGLTQNLDMLLDTMDDLKRDYPDIHLVLIGDGAYKQQAESIIANKGMTNVHMIPFQPYEDISHVFSLGDAGLVISKPKVGSNSVPSKTWSIMSASRPVLASFDENELKDIIEGHGCGLFTNAGDKEAFKESVLKLYNDRSLCRELGQNGRQFVLDHLTREVGTQKYVEVIKSFVE